MAKPRGSYRFFPLRTTTPCHSANGLFIFIRAPGYFTLIGDEAPLAARDSSEAAFHYVNVALCLISCSGWSVGFSIPGEAMDIDRSAPQGLNAIRTLRT